MYDVHLRGIYVHDLLVYDVHLRSIYVYEGVINVTY